MIKINKMTRGRFGNKVLQYNTLRQLSSILGVEYSCPSWEGQNIFNLSLSSEKPVTTKEEKLLTWRECIEPDWDKLKDMSDKYDLVIDDPAYVLHNTFFQFCQSNPREFLPIKENFTNILSPNTVNVGIHIRGTDILGADGNQGREIHDPEYYIRSIDLVESEHNNVKLKYYICTDDMNFASFRETVRYLQSKNYPFEVGDINNHFLDFCILADCDILIASSSTFVVCAAFLGKEGKKVIHSRDWMVKNKEHLPWNSKNTPPDTRKMQLSFDDFWVNLCDNGNQFYKVWKLM
tara:strand:+ start:2958 stop:3833 length:876 start_codon:yes stop_codon:yes gene_type:complete